MKYKQLSPEIVIRSSDGERVPINDPDYLAWLDEGNSPFPPDPPTPAELEEIITSLEE